MKASLSIIVVGIIISACGSNGSVKDNRNAKSESTIAAGGQSEKELAIQQEEMRKEEARLLKEKSESSTTMSFDRKYHDFGNVKTDVENTTTFIVTNTGNKPLIIEDVTASCGCTTPQKPEKPILPGKSDKITVTFKAKPDQLNEQVKSVTVTANTTPQVEKLEIRAFVK